jgi:hypothetical protein
VCVWGGGRGVGEGGRGGGNIRWAPPAAAPGTNTRCRPSCARAPGSLVGVVCAGVRQQHVVGREVHLRVGLPGASGCVLAAVMAQHRGAPLYRRRAGGRRGRAVAGSEACPRTARAALVAWVPGRHTNGGARNSRASSRCESECKFALTGSLMVTQCFTRSPKRSKQVLAYSTKCPTIVGLSQPSSSIWGHSRGGGREGGGGLKRARRGGPRAAGAGGAGRERACAAVAFRLALAASWLRGWPHAPAGSGAGPSGRGLPPALCPPPPGWQRDGGSEAAREARPAGHLCPEPFGGGGRPAAAGGGKGRSEAGLRGPRPAARLRPHPPAPAPHSSIRRS